MKQLLYIDLFCGAGGTSTGVNAARLHGEQCAEVIACVNHDAKAIASHAANHPNAWHFPDDWYYDCRVLRWMYIPYIPSERGGEK